MIKGVITEKNVLNCFGGTVETVKLGQLPKSMYKASSMRTSLLEVVDNFH